MKSLRHRNRMREIDADVLVKVKEEMGFSWKEIGQLLGVSAAQVGRYIACGKVPADRFYAARDALLIDTEQRAREEREKILELFSLTPLT